MPPPTSPLAATDPRTLPHPAPGSEASNFTTANDPRDPALSHSSHCSHSSHASPPTPNEEQSTKNQELPITVSSLAEFLGCGRASIRHYASLLGLRFTTRIVGARKKRVACLTPEDAQEVVAAYQRELASVPSDTESQAANERRTRNQEPGTAPGLLCLLQLEPEHDPGRVQLAFTKTLEGPIEEFLEHTPFAICLARWPARASWEQTAIASISQSATHVHAQIYHTENPRDLIAAGNQFFALLPDPWNPEQSSARVNGRTAQGSPLIAPACSSKCGREAAPPGSQTSRCGQAEGGAEQAVAAPALPTYPPAPPHNFAQLPTATEMPHSPEASRPRASVFQTARWGEAPPSPDLRRGQAAGGAEQTFATPAAPLSTPTHPSEKSPPGIPAYIARAFAALIAFLCAFLSALVPTRASASPLPAAVTLRLPAAPTPQICGDSSHAPNRPAATASRLGTSSNEPRVAQRNPGLKSPIPSG